MDRGRWIVEQQGGLAGGHRLRSSSLSWDPGPLLRQSCLAQAEQDRRRLEA